MIYCIYILYIMFRQPRKQPRLVSEMTYYVSPSQERCYSHRRETPLKSEARATHTTIDVPYGTYLGSMVAACCPQKHLSSFIPLVENFLLQNLLNDNQGGTD